MLLAAGAQADGKPERFAVYYTNVLPAKAFEAYDTLVFDSEHHPELRPLQHRGKTLLGYLSLGEAENYRPYYPKLAHSQLLLARQGEWSGHYFVDVRKSHWVELVIEQLIPEILHQGFDGIFLDTVDSSVALDAQNAGMTAAVTQLIFAIRMHYPQVKVMLNRGFDILPQVVGSVDMVLAESIYTTYDFKTKKHRKQPAEVYQSVSAMLKQQQAQHPALKIYTLDYWPPEDAAAIKAVYAAQRANGFVPSVATVDLQQLVAEPE
jgi:uncharacterized protein (TIGR01370 family)